MVNKLDSGGGKPTYIYQARLTRPLAGNKYYMTVGSGGYSYAVKGKPTDPQCDVLSNCVGYAYGRFNEIGQYGDCRYLKPVNAEKFWLAENHQGCEVGQTPRLGACMVWKKGETLQGDDGAGHVAIVEEIISPTEVRTSESAWDYIPAFYLKNRVKGEDGNWGAFVGYTFLGFIYNPAVPYGVAKVEELNESYGGAISENQLKDILHSSSPLYMFETQTITETLTRDAITTIDREYSDIDSYNNNLLSYPSLVETPYINVTIGDYVFGKYNETVVNNKTKKIFPNFINSMTIVKTNGTVNMYTIDMLYQIRTGDDPNFIDKIFSSVGYGKIKISYGDYSSPAFIYKEEEAIITKVVSRVDFSNSSISYTISCTSSALSVMGSNFNFNFRHAQPSSIIYELLVNSKRYGLDSIFPALTGKNLVKNFSRFIATDDQVVDIPAKNYTDPISYINYLVSYMVPRTDPVSSTQRSATYYMTIHDDSYSSLSSEGGTYFKVTKINSTYTTLPTFNTYTVDVGYPGTKSGENLVLGFTIQDDNSWALLYDYSSKNQIAAQENYSYSVDREGNIVQNYSPNITLNAVHGKTTAAMKSWWTRMTEFPIKATLVIKGLIRPAILMTYLRVNTYFYGKKHVSSGLFVITKQEDRIDGSGYRTTLSLTRIAGADDIVERREYQVTSDIITNIRRIPEESIVPESYERSGVRGQYFGQYKVPKGCLLSVCTDYYDPPDGIYNLYMDINKKPFTDTQEEFNRTNKAYKTYRTDLIWRDNPTSHQQFPESGVVTDREYVAPAYEWFNSTGNSTGLVWLQLDDGNLYFHSMYHERYDPNIDQYREGTELEKVLT